jgi:hypothetical protein
MAAFCIILYYLISMSVAGFRQVLFALMGNPTRLFPYHPKGIQHFEILKFANELKRW